jgi:mitogen-activated protein kinase 1/3
VILDCQEEWIWKIQQCQLNMVTHVYFHIKVATRWYRAPELIMMWEKCSKEIDVWSIGCVLFELLQDIPRKPVFPGKNYLDQLDIILQFTGTPKEEDIFACEKAKSYLSKLPLKLKKKISRHPLIPMSNIFSI